MRYAIYYNKKISTFDIKTLKGNRPFKKSTKDFKFICEIPENIKIQIGSWGLDIIDYLTSINIKLKL